jgi:hypothetical protein
MSFLLHAEYIDEPSAADSRWGFHGGFGVGALGVLGGDVGIIGRVDPTALYRLAGDDKTQLAFGFGVVLAGVLGATNHDNYLVFGPALSLEYMNQAL